MGYSRSSSEREVHSDTGFIRKEENLENKLMDMGRGEERVRCMERVIWKLTLPYVK